MISAAQVRNLAGKRNDCCKFEHIVENSESAVSGEMNMQARARIGSSHSPVRWLLLTLICFFIVNARTSNPAHAQSPAGFDDIGRLESVVVKLENPSPDEALNRRLIDRIRVGLGIFPGDMFSRTTAEFNLARARRGAPITRTNIVAMPGPTGGISVTILATIGPSEVEGRGALISGKASDLPVFYDRNGTFLRMRLEGISMYYGNNHAWYGNPGPLLAGNPLVRGKSAGRGYSHWAEGFVHAGLYGITPLGDNISVYGGLSGIYSGSVGQELFTDKTRSYFGVEDAFIGIVGGTTSSDGNRFVFNASAGRQRFGVGDGFLIANTASNGGNRGALQSNPRWAADGLALLQARYNNTKMEAFYIDPDELPEVDSRTKLIGVNLETRLPGGFDIGAMYLYVPQSKFDYYTASDVFSRQGLQVYNARMRWQPNPAGAGLFLAGEAGLQRNDRFDMRAYAWTAELGYSFAATLPWSPTISYRYASFSGDDPSTKRFERWDPLLSGDNGERWVQGINHFKIFQNSNLSTHRIQMRLRPFQSIELVPQFWLFTADRTTNLGGNPAFSFVQGRYLGAETNLTVKWFISPKLMLQGHVAATFPSTTVRKTIGASPDPWISTMVFLRASF
ncbi:MAG: alginate export family protein [Methylobacterium sp.]|nr:alginate export family protein [Methylobacterium sp.]MCA3605482.1 alginate export family protein [Methylobacterium sp.]MCA3607982.1 alginate export family protein [Methylobacterium sp.]MCA3616706.1 alginate export family protein [Methylobacterium sp.]MCA3620021.1 alginate export family protein [Methylobacterium sp.]